MKTKLLLSVLFGLVGGGALAAATVDKPAPPVEVIFVAPEKFTDVKADSMDSAKGRAVLLEQLKEHLIASAANYLAAGQRLEVRVTDVDLAGGFEPWRGPDFDDIRIVKDIYPPRVDLEFRLLGADGKILAEGKRQLRSLGYLLTVAWPTSDPLRYDKAVLSDWLRQEFRRAS